jgi:hypothetical protein
MLSAAIQKNETGWP